MKSFSRVRLFVTPWTVAYQAPLPMGFSRLGYWSGLPLPSPGDLPNPGIEPRLPHCRQTLYRLSHQGSPDGKESACNVGDPGSVPKLGRSPGEGNGNPLQYSCLENPVDRGAWQGPQGRKESDTTEACLGSCYHTNLDV